MGKKLTTQQFVYRAQQKHGNRYDYSHTQYVGADDKVAVVCQTHGTFYQRPVDHLRGSGCSQCNERQTLTQDQFIDRANKQHSSKYTYGSVVYKNVTTKVSIQCQVHGIFQQTPKDHLRGYGCPDCGGTKKITTQNFIDRAKSIHKNTYRYSRTQLDSMNSKVVITCKNHGDFSQRPADHLNGVGCPICGNYKQGGYTEEYFSNNPDKKNLNGQLYLISIDEKLCKLGITKKQYVKQRFPGVRFEVIAAKSMSLYEAYCAEQSILRKYKKHRYKTKDLKTTRQTGWTECFPLSLAPQLLQELNNSIPMEN